ncbi:MAG: hypothetical protein IJ443_02365 [Firmicutes bacterium]|nr:hypothetical protein [Bacillota bacterium]
MNLINFVIVITVVTAGMLLVKWGLGGRITPRGHMLMWLLVGILTAALPLANLLPDADWSLRSYVPQVTETEIYRQDVPRDDGIVYNEITMRENTVSMKVPVTDQRVEKTFLAAVDKVERRDWWVAILWGGGAAALALALLAVARRQCRQLQLLPNCSDAAVTAIFEEVRHTMGIRRELGLKTGAEAIMLAGMRRPAVYLTADGTEFTAAELRHVFAHELTHYKHRDLHLNVLSAVYLCAFWWNPVLWLAFHRFHLDMEVYCDWDAARVTGDRKEYALTLVKAAVGQNRFLLATTSLVKEEHQVSRHVKTLARLKKPKVWVSVLAVCILLGVCVGLAVNPAEGDSLLTDENVEFLWLSMRNSQGEEVVLDMDGQKAEFLRAVNGSWTKRDVWRDVDIDKGDAKAVVQAYLENIAQPAASFEFKSSKELLSSHSVSGDNNVKLYSWDAFERGIVVLQRKSGKRYISDSPELWDGLMDIIAEVTVMRDVVFETASKEANWFHEGVLHQKDFDWDGSAQQLDDYLFGLHPGGGSRLSDAEVTEYLNNPRFDYWADLWPEAGGHKIIGHLASEPDGEGRTIVLSPNVGSGEVYDDPDLAYLLANTVKLELLPESALDWYVCSGDMGYEEALAVFAAKYFDRQSKSDRAYLEAVCEGTFRESDTSNVTDYTVEMVSERQNAVLFRWMKETTYYNDIMGQVEIWAGAGPQDLQVNADGTVTIRNENHGYLLNDGQGWYYVDEIKAGYNTDLCVNEDGSLKDGLICY